MNRLMNDCLGREEIETLCKLLSERIQFLAPESDTLLLVPLYGALTPELQSKVFEQTPPKTRKVVVSTNIAETSITVPNIRYVIDPGVVKARLAGASITVSGGTGGSRDQVTPMTSSALVVVSVSRSQAWQRAGKAIVPLEMNHVLIWRVSGRCGRVAGGKVYRLYTEETFLKLPISFPAEIKRVSLETLVLTLLNLGHRDVLNFPYLQQPAPQARTFVYFRQQCVLTGNFSEKSTRNAMDSRCTRQRRQPFRIRQTDGTVPLGATLLARAHCVATVQVHR